MNHSKSPGLDDRSASVPLKTTARSGPNDPAPAPAPAPHTTRSKVLNKGLRLLNTGVELGVYRMADLIESDTLSRSDSHDSSGREALKMKA